MFRTYVRNGSVLHLAITPGRIEALDQNDGLFPKPQEIKLSCSCPDHAGLSAHSIANWETKGGPLKLQAASLERLQTLALEAAPDA